MPATAKEGLSKDELLTQLQGIPDADSDTSSSLAIPGDPVKKPEGVQYEYLSGQTVEALFSAFMDPITVPFKIGEHDCSVTLRQMNADQMAKYRDLIARFATKEDENGEDKYFFEPDTALADVALLCGTVEGMTLYFDAPSRNGGEKVKTLYPFPAPGPMRVEMFRKMLPKLRALLVNECKKANGLHPLSQGEDTSTPQK